MTRAAPSFSLPNLDLDAPENQPSVVTTVPWLHAYASRRKGPSAATVEQQKRQNGLWLVWVAADALDDTWLVVREALARGELGWAAKAMTAQARRFGAAAEFDTDPTAQQNAERLIVVYCRRDDADATRVRAALRALGIRWRLPYKWSFGGSTRRFE